MNVRYLIGGALLSMALPAGHAVAQTDAQNDDARPITLVGCIMRESDYRDMYGPGQSGPRGAGLGLRNEYMIVDAHEVSGGGSGVAETTGTCTPGPGGFPTAYELTGPREREAAPFLGRRVELTGMQKRAHTRAVGTTGLRQPTGGFDPLGHELHVFEVEVGSMHEALTARAAEPVTAPAPVAEAAPAAIAEAPTAAVAEAPPAAAEVAEPAAAPAPAETAAAPEPTPVAPEPAASAPAPAPQTAQQAPQEQPRQIARAELPKTASPLPLVGLIGLLSLAAAAGMRSMRNRDERAALKGDLR
jgi:hypothetical protein